MRERSQFRSRIEGGKTDGTAAGGNFDAPLLSKKTVALVLSVLARGLKVCRSVDEPVREVFDGFPEDFIFVLGVYGSRHPVVLQNRRTGLYRAHETVAAASQKIPLPPATALAKAFFCRRV